MKDVKEGEGEKLGLQKKLAHKKWRGDKKKIT
jgi:hypothetical protein